MTFAILPDQVLVPCVLMRGGTSKGVYFHDKDLPVEKDERDRFLMRVMGTPDLMQIDGLGGSRLVTSKIAIVRPSNRPDADVDYTFAQVDIERELIGYDGNCGNISSGVGPFAIDEGLIDAIEPFTVVRIYNRNTGKILVARVPVAGGKARVIGDCAIAGVPGTGAEILMDFSGTVGAKTGRLLPTGNVVDQLTLIDGRTIEITIADAANPCVFLTANSLGLDGTELPTAISGNERLIATIGEIQSKVGQMIGMWPDWTRVHLPGVPLFVMVAAPTDYVDMNGRKQLAIEHDLCARLVFLGKCHESMAGTGSICTAAASRVSGSVVNKILGPGVSHATTLRIGHPLGAMGVKVETDIATEGPEPVFRVLGFARTARRMMEGNVCVPVDSLNAS
ncbi:2-methylaconitate cis-trans isomerase PrpF family protein [Paraburkholderia fungorum]|uniref:PrpF protein n=1 Tax=Paraburkholderia fungorum TaxID=134537 RepID=A0A3R7L6Y3_9BURK|nr:PrpF domain-containing protein [Paraburkholderia fungorum]RKF33371.1 PrpF protein [Paraburkholderia fungorum]